MLDVFIARQPIYKRDGGLYAYELLFRQTEIAQEASFPDGDMASSHLILQALTAAGLNVLTDEHFAFINVTRNLLASDVLSSLPKQRIVLEVLEDVVADATIITAVTQLSQAGFKIALDDWVYELGNAALLSVANIVKLEVQDRTRQQLMAQLSHLLPAGVELLAEKVETQAQYDLCLELGFSFFQGYHLARPLVCKGKNIPPNRLSVLRLIARLQAADVDIQELQNIISLDISLSYQLLRLINSAFFGIPRKVESVRHAIVILGADAIRKWATLLMLAGLDNRPSALVKEAFVRGRMCELLARQTQQLNPEKFFTVGLFSVLEQLLQIPIQQILDDLPFTEDIVNALLIHDGVMGQALSCVNLFASGPSVEQRCFLHLTEQETAPLYIKALMWAHEFCEEMQIT